MKAFFITTAALEVGAGLALILAPLQAATLLLGASPIGLGADLFEKVAGFALIALALANWLARNDTQCAAARGIVWGMLIYNLGIIEFFFPFALAPLVQQQPSQTVGVLVCPAVILHIVMSMWCGLCLAKKRV
ncbi:hypothetical protein KBI23_00965 [bacterium]|nr:hypothetical protein [bacterium]MBP9808923.1 hypothetical protein [bacterium]